MSPTVDGLDKLGKRFDTADFVTPGARQFLRDWSDGVKTKAQRNVAVFRGDTKDSIEAKVDGATFPTWAETSVTSPTGRWREFGTGLLSEDPRSARRAYFPPPERLRDWSVSKGLDPYQVAQGIFTKGGTPPTHFFSDAIDDTGKDMSGMIQRFGGKIEFDASH